MAMSRDEIFEKVQEVLVDALAVDDDEVIAAVLHELRGNFHAGGLTASIWAQAQALRIKRMEPIPRFGKIATLYLAKTERSISD